MTKSLFCVGDTVIPSIEEISKDIERDYFMSAQDALDYGIIDHVMPSRK